MAYFDRFPLMTYDVKNNNQYKLLPDILRRVKLRAAIKSGVFLFDKYDVPYGDKPEDVAFKFYGAPALHWVILMTNNVTDRYYQWPMTQPQFEEFLADKYGAGNEDSIHHYEKARSSGRTTSNGPGDISHLVEVNSDEDGASSVSNREYEERLQDGYRQIRLLDPKFITTFTEEFFALVRK